MALITVGRIVQLEIDLRYLAFAALHVLRDINGKKVGELSWFHHARDLESQPGAGVGVYLLRVVCVERYAIRLGEGRVHPGAQLISRAC